MDDQSLCPASLQSDLSTAASQLSVMLFPTLALALACISKYLLRKIPIPHTVALLLVGGILGVFSCLYYIPVLSESILLWGKVSPPDLILYGLLPPLLYEGAQNMDWFYVKRSLPKICILAFVLVPIHALGVALAMKFLFRVQWNMDVAIMFGALMSATDPVAVVSLLKTTGAPKQLVTVIEGESLFNDGTSFVIFEVFLSAVIKSAQGAQQTAGFSFLLELLWEIAKLSIGGFFAGVLLGLGTVLFLRFVYNDADVEIGITFGMAYFVFYIAQGPLNVSGPIAVVVFGLTMSAFGVMHVSPRLHHDLHVFWEVIVFLCNALAFVFSGVLCALLLIENWKDSIGIWDLFMIPLFYLFLHILRAGGIALLSPLLNRFAYGFKSVDAALLSYSGLRGAVALIMAVIVHYKLDVVHVPHAVYENVAPRISIWTSGIVILTLVVNGSTVGFLASKLGLSSVPEAKLVYLEHSQEELKGLAERIIRKIRRAKRFAQADVDVLCEFFEVSLAEKSENNENDFAADDESDASFLTTQKTLAIGAASAFDSSTVSPSESELQAGSRSKMKKKEVKDHVRNLSMKSGSADFGALDSTLKSLSVFIGDGQKLDGNNKEVFVDSKKYAEHPVNRIRTRLGYSAMVEVVRKRVVLQIRRSIAHQFKNGLVSPPAMVSLRALISDAIDSADQPLSLCTFFEPVAGFSRFESWLLNALARHKSTRGISRRILFYVQSQHHEKCDAATALWAALVSARRRTWVGGEVLKEIEQARTCVLRYLRDLEACYPSVLRLIHTRQAARAVLRALDEYVDSLENQGEDDDVMKTIRKELSDLEDRAIFSIPSLVLRKTGSVRDVICTIPWISNISPNDLRLAVIDLVLEHGHDVFLQKGDVIVSQGDIPDGVFVLIRGSVSAKAVIDFCPPGLEPESETVSEDPDNEDVFQPIGTVFGTQSIVGIPLLKSYIVDSESAHLFHIRRKVLESLYSFDGKVELEYYRELAIKVVKILIPGAVDAFLGRFAGFHRQETALDFLDEMREEEEDKRVDQLESSRAASIAHGHDQSPGEQSPLLSSKFKKRSDTLEDFGGLSDDSEFREACEEEELFGASLLREFPQHAELLKLRPGQHISRNFTGVLCYGLLFKHEGNRRTFRNAPMVLRTQGNFQAGPKGCIAVLLP